MSLYPHKAGFTLVELAVVLVIIGLIIGGVLVGQDLINSARLQAQVKQIDKYQAAVETFRAKYSGLPGDLILDKAKQFGFITTSCDGSSTGNRDGNGLIDGTIGEAYGQGEGETAFFWTDLSTAGLIESKFPGGTAPTCNSCPIIALSGMSQYFPATKIGGGYVYVFEMQGANWFSIDGMAAVQACGNVTRGVSLGVLQALNIDEKIDDGFPESGSVQAYGPITAAVLNYAQNLTFAWPTNCFNSNAAYPQGVYSTFPAVGDNSTLPNCFLSFRMQ
jgi:prepilin-type N-terminal cleavage/methylation domain-containing protein